MLSGKSDTQGGATAPFLITFSGIDGAGKTTQIEQLTSFLEKQRLRVLRLSFWDDVAVWSNMRAEVGQLAAEAMETGQAPLKFSPKNNKHVRKWYLTAARSGLYVLDVARLRRLLMGPQIRNTDVVIFDRYIYDQIANIHSRSLTARLYGKILLQRAPAPDLAFILDASPDEAFARKPEYPLDFMYRNRRNFLRLRELVPELIVIPGADVESVRQQIQQHVCLSRLVHQPAQENAYEGKAEIAVADSRSPATEFL